MDDVIITRQRKRETLTFRTAFGTELKHPVAAGLGGPGLMITVGKRAIRPSTNPFLGGGGGRGGERAARRIRANESEALSVGAWVTLILLLLIYLH